MTQGRFKVIVGLHTLSGLLYVRIWNSLHPAFRVDSLE